MDARIVTLIAVVLIGGLIGAAIGFGEVEGPQGPPPAQRIEPGPNDVRLEAPAGPDVVFGGAAALPSLSAAVSQASGTANTASWPYAGYWLPRGGWRGEVLRARLSQGVHSIRVGFEASTTAGSIWMEIKIPGDAGDIERGDYLRFDGKLVGVEASDDILLIGHKIFVEQASVLEHRKVN